MLFLCRPCAGKSGFLKAIHPFVWCFMLIILVCSLQEINLNGLFTTEQRNNYNKPGHKEFKFDPVHTDNVKVQFTRKQLIAKHCNGNEIVSPATQFLVEERHQLLYCNIPKVASSNIKRLILLLSGHVDPKEFSSVYNYNIHFKNPIRNITADNMEELYEQGVGNYSKFMITRHPFERLVSAYYDKFTDNNKSRVVPFATDSVTISNQLVDKKIERHWDNSKFFKIGRKIIEKYRDNPSQLSLKEGNDVTVPEFVNYVIDEWAGRVENPVNPHWKSQFELCRPCSIDYDVVGKFETMQEDIDYLLEQLEEEEISKIFHEYKPYTTSSLVTEFMEQVSDQQWKKLVRIYQDDFDIFGYDPDVYAL